MLANLNRAFGIDGHVAFENGPCGFIVAKLTHQNGSTVSTTLYGGHVISWKDRFSRERLFMSKSAVFQNGKAIRGGIPIIFPQFGGGPLPSHGFARTALWQCSETRELADGAVVLKLFLSNSPETEKVWPHQFKAELEIILQDVLTMVLRVENLGNRPFTFQNAFHTYFPISDIAEVAVMGLGGLEYLDNLQSKAKMKEESDRIVIDREVDRVYLRTPESVTIEDFGAGRTIYIGKQQLSDAVVWNPWIEKSKTLTDLEPEDFKRFICVETGNIGTAVTVAPNELFACSQSIR